MWCGIEASAVYIEFELRKMQARHRLRPPGLWNPSTRHTERAARAVPSRFGQRAARGLTAHAYTRAAQRCVKLRRASQIESWALRGREPGKTVRYKTALNIGTIINFSLEPFLYTGGALRAEGPAYFTVWVHVDVNSALL